VVSANLLIEARRRAGLSQRELAGRSGVGQQEIARYERGRVTPSLERLRQLVAACELELTFGLARADSSYDDAISRMLAIPSAQRLARGLRDAESVRATGAHAHGAPALPDALGVLRALESSGVRYVLTGELAEVLCGSPLLPLSGTVTIVPRAGESEALRDVLIAGRARYTPGSRESPPDAAERRHLETFHADLAIVPAPAGTHGYQDLRRAATQLQIDEASHDRARMPALRRTLELSASAAGAGSARAA
jgi:transcriptional regulator with XRE-family HTH domain